MNNPRTKATQSRGKSTSAKKSKQKPYVPWYFKTPNWALCIPVSHSARMLYLIYLAELFADEDRDRIVYIPDRYIAYLMATRDPKTAELVPESLRNIRYWRAELVRARWLRKPAKGRGYRMRTETPVSGWHSAQEMKSAAARDGLSRLRFAPCTEREHIELHKSRNEGGHLSRTTPWPTEAGGKRTGAGRPVGTSHEAVGCPD